MCTGTEESLQDCDVVKQENRCLCSTNIQGLVWITCNPGTNITECLKTNISLLYNIVLCPKERVRLLGGSPQHPGQGGLVEVCSDGRWGTVQTSQPQQVAREVCRRLNLSEITSDGKKSDT